MANFLIIRDLCDKKKVTLRSLANKVGISEDGLQKIINKGRTNTDTLEKIAKVFDVPVATFFETAFQSSLENNVSVNPEAPTESRLLSIVESQQRTIETLSNKISKSDE